MFDIAYLPEASIEACEIEYRKEWNKVLNSDLSKPFGPVFFIMGSIYRINEIKFYWKIMYYTHGV